MTKQIFRAGWLTLLAWGTVLSFLMVAGMSSAAEKRVKLGAEVFLEDFPQELRGKSIGLVINQASILPDGKSTLQAFVEKGHQVRAIFSPEHGFDGLAEAGEEVADSLLGGIRIWSLYGKTKKPTPEQMEGIEAFIYDIQDVGVRFYTYITTLKHVLEAASEGRISVYVLDRPNPLGGEVIEGPLMRPEYESFIGALPIPVRYGLTAGELAMMIKGEGWIAGDFDLHVVRMKNWKRSFFWEDTGLRWIPTSPNMPTPETALIYPGAGMLGALKLNEGGGTGHPFLQFGAPWLDTSFIIQKLKRGMEFGLQLEAVSYTPQSLPGKVIHPIYENRLCRGIRVRVQDKGKVRPIRFYLAFVQALLEKHRADVSVNSRALSQMFGNELLTRFIMAQMSLEELISEMEKEEGVFREKRQPYLLYE